jgi:hypothetical protein
MVRTKQTAGKRPKKSFQPAVFSSQLFWCPERSCSRFYQHRQSLYRHRCVEHGRLQLVNDDVEPDDVISSPQPSGNARMRAVLSSPSTSFEDLLRYMDSDEAAATFNQEAAPMDEALQNSAAPAAPSTVPTTLRGVVPKKEMRAKPSLRLLTADSIAKRWLPTPAVSSEAACGMLQDMPSYSPFSIAATAQRRLGLTAQQRVALRRRLSTAAMMERRIATATTRGKHGWQLCDGSRASHRSLASASRTATVKSY